MKAALAAYVDIFPPGTANTGGSQRTARSPECAPSIPKLYLRANRTPRCYVTLLHCGRIFNSVCPLSRAFAVARLLGLRVCIPDVCLHDCCVSVRRTDHSSRGVLPSVVCLSVIVKPRYGGDPGPLGAVAPCKEEGCGSFPLSFQIEFHSSLS